MNAITLDRFDYPDGTSKNAERPCKYTKHAHVRKSTGEVAKITFYETSELNTQKLSSILEELSVDYIYVTYQVIYRQ
jgi:hypothetical protein